MMIRRIVIEIIKEKLACTIREEFIMGRIIKIRLFLINNKEVRVVSCERFKKKRKTSARITEKYVLRR